MDVGVLGSGVVAQRLAAGFASRGHRVTIGTRDPAKLAEWLDGDGRGVTTGSFPDAAAAGDVVCLAVLGAAAEELVRSLAGELGDCVLIDSTNPLEYHPGGPPTLFVGHDDSLGERVQRAAPSARVVKCFNSVGNSCFFDPEFPGGPPTMFYCGDDDAAKTTVREVLDSFGWESDDLGGIEVSRYLEPLCMLWVVHGFRAGSWNHAFKLLEA
jgi:predicted dinucleotide-binding enzyme